MATRQQRINAFIHEGDPPADQPLELLCEDHVRTYVIPFLSAVERAGMSGLIEGQKVSFDVVADRRTGKSAAENLRTV
jgi:hypothetical protein